MINVNMTWEEFEREVVELAKQIKKSKIRITNIYGLPRGGIIVGVRLSHLLDKPLITNWEDHNDNTLIVDDCVDSGQTLAGKACACIWNIAVLVYSPKASFEPSFWVKKKTSNEWIVFPWEKI